MTKTPKAKTPPTDEQLKAFCDREVTRAIDRMEKRGASFPMILDRLLTYCGAFIALNEGSAVAASKFHMLGDNISSGVFHGITGEGARQH
jgi:hypothetical protein